MLAPLLLACELPEVESAFGEEEADDELLLDTDRLCALCVGDDMSVAAVTLVASDELPDLFSECDRDL